MPFNFGNTTTGIRIRQPQVRVTEIATPVKPAARPASTASRSQPRARSNEVPNRAVNGASRSTSVRSDGAPTRSQTSSPRKRRRVERQQLIDSDSDDDEASTPSLNDFSRESRAPSVQNDTNRRLRSRTAFSEDAGSFKGLHAADVAHASRKFRPVWGSSQDDGIDIRLQYPSRIRPERYVYIPFLHLHG
jgi:hypothetical protein